MKDEKKVKATEEVKTEKADVQLTEEDLAQVTGGKENFGQSASKTSKLICQIGLSGEK